jgi:hypothetical protein
MRSRSGAPCTPKAASARPSPRWRRKAPTVPPTRPNWLDQRGIFSRHGDSGWQFLLVLIGFLIMVVAIVPGARFWFGLLSKLGSLRATGPKPT